MSLAVAYPASVCANRTRFVGKTPGMRASVPTVWAGSRSLTANGPGLTSETSPQVVSASQLRSVLAVAMARSADARHYHWKLIISGDRSPSRGWFHQAKQKESS
jgi:hypothetical protein